MNKLLKKSLSVCLCLSVALCACVTGLTLGASAESYGEFDFTIENPYKDVVWGEWGQYKTSLHSHTNLSDAVPTVAESVEKHYELGFDILAITDHAVLGKPWTSEEPSIVPLYRFVKFGNAGQKNMQPLSQERSDEIKAGVGRDGRGMLEVTGAAELNGATPINDCHVNGFFAGWGQALMGVYGDYETVVKNVRKAGGITFLDHVGEYVGCEDDPERARNPYYINKLSNIFLKYPSCTAIDVNSGMNNRTRYDYILWDEILMTTIPYGRNVSCIAFSDAHHIDQYDRAFTMMCMPSNSVENLRTSMETGAYFSIGRYARADLGEEFVGEGPVPSVTSLDVNQDTDTISFAGENYDNVKWISNGVVIAEGAGKTSLDLNDYEDVLGCYVRFTITGPGGILYSQAFPIKAPGFEITKRTLVPTIDVAMFLRGTVNTLSALLGWTPPILLLRWLLWGRVWWIY